MKGLKAIGTEAAGNRWLWIGLLAIYGYAVIAGEPMSRQAYISTYADLAMREMARTGIPASIKLAQGCLESDNGNSRLAARANNHFGIKCHDWTGRKIYHDDDARRECFRSYASAYESFMDHSLFLTTKSRYTSLFELNPDDYKAWAKGLKRAGYATARDYSQLLIRIIEENELYKYDQMVLEEGPWDEPQPGSPVLANAPPGAELEFGRQVLVNNRIEYVVAQPGDTPESLRQEMDLFRNEIYRYNEILPGEAITPGEIIYLQPKRRKASRGNEIHVVREGETMYEISQLYGVKIKHLFRLNLMDEGQEPSVGTELHLRKKRREPLLRLEAPEPAKESSAGEMQFRFEY